MNPQYLAAWNLYGVDPSTVTPTPDQQAAIDAGLVNKVDREYSNEGGGGSMPAYDVQWDKLPQMGPHTDTPANTIWTPHNPANTAYATYNDPNYGLIDLVRDQAPNDKSMDILRSLAIAAAVGPAAAALAPAAAGALGYGAGQVGAGSGLAAEALGAESLTAGGLTTWPSTLIGGAIRALPRAAGMFTEAPSSGYTPAAWHEALGAMASSVTAPKAAPQADPNTPVAAEPGYFPDQYGNMGSFPAYNDNSSAPVATAVSPDAYSNSYNSITA